MNEYMKQLNRILLTDMTLSVVEQMPKMNPVRKALRRALYAALTDNAEQIVRLVCKGGNRSVTHRAVLELSKGSSLTRVIRDRLHSELTTDDRVNDVVVSEPIVLCETVMVVIECW